MVCSEGQVSCIKPILWYFIANFICKASTNLLSTSLRMTDSFLVKKNYIDAASYNISLHLRSEWIAGNHTAGNDVTTNKVIIVPAETDANAWYKFVKEIIVAFGMIDELPRLGGNLLPEQYLLVWWGKRSHWVVKGGYQRRKGIINGLVAAMSLLRGGEVTKWITLYRLHLLQARPLLFDDLLFPEC